MPSKSSTQAPNPDLLRAALEEGDTEALLSLLYWTAPDRSATPFPMIFTYTLPNYGQASYEVLRPAPEGSYPVFNTEATIRLAFELGFIQEAMTARAKLK